MSSIDPAEPLLEKHTAEVRQLTQELRALVVETIPGLTEKVHLGWSAIHYLHGAGMKGVVVALLPQKSYVNLEFRDGAQIADPTQRLEGTGKGLRRIKIRCSDDVRHPDVRELLRTQARYRDIELPAR